MKRITSYLSLLHVWPLALLSPVRAIVADRRYDHHTSRGRLLRLLDKRSVGPVRAADAEVKNPNASEHREVECVDKP